MAPLNLNIQTVAVTTAVSTGVLLGLYLYQKKKKNAVPLMWEPVGNVTALYLYPLKSGRRMELEAIECTDHGLKLVDESLPHVQDRCLLVYKEVYKEFKTALTFPKLLLISVTADHDHFTLTAPGTDILQIKIPNESNEDNKVVMRYKTKTFVRDCGQEAARWISQYLQNKSSGFRLGFHDSTKIYKECWNIFSSTDNLLMNNIFCNFKSVNLMNQLSVDDLVGRIPSAGVSVHNFRPNVVINGEKLKPFCEDDWDWIKIGPVILRKQRLCVRCPLTTINPETGIKSRDHEPMKTLKTYRKAKDPSLIENDFEKDSPVLGINMNLIYGGQINIGDIVYVGIN